MSFMQAELTPKQEWISVDGNCGVDVFPADLIDVTALRALLDSADELPDEAKAMCKDYTENTDIREIEIIFGYGVRSTAPGYMDCTPWTVYTSKREANRAARQEQRECDGDE